MIADPVDANAIFLMEQGNSRDLIYRVRVNGDFRPVRVFRSAKEPVLAQEATASLFADPTGSYLLVNVSRGRSSAGCTRGCSTDWLRKRSTGSRGLGDWPVETLIQTTAKLSS